jgi:hypothetical protein
MTDRGSGPFGRTRAIGRDECSDWFQPTSGSIAKTLAGDQSSWASRIPVKGHRAEGGKKLR